MPYESGYTSAVNSTAQRQGEQARIAAMLQQLAQSQWQQQQQQQQMLQKQQAEARAGSVLSQMGPQSPPPGQASVPMMPPGAAPQQAAPPPMAPPPMGMGGPPNNMGAPPPTMGAGAPPTPPMPPQGWQASAAAPTALGGPGKPPAPPGGPQGMPPPPMGGMGAPPMGGAPPQPPGGPGAGGQPGVLPPQMLSVPNAIAKMRELGVPPEKMIQTLEAMLPTINASNKEALDGLRAETMAQKAAIEAYRATMAAQLQPMRVATAQQNADNASVRAGNAGVNAETAKLNAETRSRKAAGGGGGGAAPATSGLTHGALEDAADQYNRDKTIPSLYRDAASKRAIMNMAAERKRSGEDSGIATDRAGFKADQGSLNFQQKRVDAIEGSMKKIGKDITTLDSVLDKNAFTDAKVINTPVNKLRRAMSDPGLAQLDLAAQQVGTEYERLLTSGMMSVAQLHAGAAEDAKKLINGDMSPKEIRAKVQIMRREMDNAKSAATEQLGEIKTRMKGGKAAPAGDTGGIPAGWSVKEH